MHHSRTRGQTAFSLVELLVVIAITAVMVAALLPALDAARSAARGTVCMSNLRTLHMTHGNYANDFGRYVGGDWYRNLTNNIPAIGDLNAPQRRWQAVLARGDYIVGNKNPNWGGTIGVDGPQTTISGVDIIEYSFPDPTIMRCPEDPVRNNEYSISYRISGGVQGSNAFGYEVEGLLFQKPAAILYPDKTAMFFEGKRTTLTSGGSDWDNGYSGSDCRASEFQQLKIAKWHGYTNLIFCDGHLEVFKKDLNPNVAGVQTLPTPIVTATGNFLNMSEGNGMRRYFWGVTNDGAAPFRLDGVYGTQ